MASAASDGTDPRPFSLLHIDSFEEGPAAQKVSATLEPAFPRRNATAPLFALNLDTLLIH